MRRLALLAGLLAAGPALARPAGTDRFSYNFLVNGTLNTTGTFVYTPGATVTIGLALRQTVGSGFVAADGGLVSGGVRLTEGGDGWCARRWPTSPSTRRSPIRRRATPPGR